MIEFIMQNIETLMLIPPAIIGLASVVAKLTDTKRDDEALSQISTAWNRASEFISKVALNPKPKI